MPFPWKKKNRVNRISQIVADLQSPKRGGSLVVQTGFPTSLIDLIVKNRNRFKKSRFKKPVRSEFVDQSPPPPPPPSPITSSSPVSDSPIHDFFCEEIVQSPSSPIREKNTKNTDGEVNFVPVKKLGSPIRSKSIIVKMLTVIVLAASVKDLTVVITVSAFALLFLENALKRSVSCLKPCSNASVAMESLFQNNVLFFHRLKTNKVSESVTVFEDDEVEFSNCVNDEIEVVNDEIEVSDCKIRGKGNRSGRFKSTMVKQLKKFRGSKKEKKEEKENNDKEIEVEIEGELGSDVSSVIGEEEIKNEVVIVSGISYSQESLILVMIVLVGLILGKLQALVLTLGWCFMVKIVRCMWRSKNVCSMIKC